MINVYVIAPDKVSGHLFCKVMKKRGINAEFNFHKIRPRVFNNKITISRDVVEDLDNIFKSFKDRTRSVVIACNTLQLWLDDINPEYRKNVKVYTTFEACEWKFQNSESKPVWLGTTPLVKRVGDFPTLITLGKPEIQDIVQELIWRLKMYVGDEFGTAPDVVKQDEGNRGLQKRKIKEMKNKILSTLVELGVKDAILGCTELPLVFDKPRMKGINFVDPANPLADYIKSQSVAIIFSGGTISSIANDSGLRISGKAFDLLERLNDKIPGAYNKLNISQADIAFKGFSENMVEKDHKKLLKSVKEVLKSDVTRIVITHGTDSMEYTARYLEKNLKKDLAKHNTNIMITGANDDIGNKDTDAWDNLRFAINAIPQSKKPAVYIAFQNRLVPANEAVKDIFDGDCMKYISKYDEGYLKRVEGYNTELGKVVDGLSGMLFEVNIVRKNLNDFWKEFRKRKPKVVIFKLYHSGTANTVDRRSSVANLVKKLRKMNILCYGVTENGEPTELNLYSSSVDLKKAGMRPLNL